MNTIASNAIIYLVGNISLREPTSFAYNTKLPHGKHKMNHIAVFPKTNKEKNQFEKILFEFCFASKNLVVFGLENSKILNHKPYIG